MARKKILDDFTEEEYWKLREELETDELVGEAKGVTGQTVKTWRWNRGIYLERYKRKPLMPDEERLKIVRQMLDKGYPLEVIAQRVKYKSKKCLQDWLCKMRKRGISI